MSKRNRIPPRRQAMTRNQLYQYFISQGASPEDAEPLSWQTHEVQQGIRKEFHAMLAFGGELCKIRSEGDYLQVYSESKFHEFCKKIFDISKKETTDMMKAYMVYSNLPETQIVFISEKELRPFYEILRQYYSGDYPDIEAEQLDNLRCDLEKICRLIEQRLIFGGFTMCINLIKESIEEFKARRLEEEIKKSKAESAL